MKNIIIFNFDKIIIIHPIQLIKTLRDACYGTYPIARFKYNALNVILSYRQNGDYIVLTANGRERMVKESLLRLHACELFDKIIIEGEQSIKNNLPGKEQLKDGTGIPIACQPEPFQYGTIIRFHI